MKTRAVEYRGPGRCEWVKFKKRRLDSRRLAPGAMSPPGPDSASWHVRFHAVQMTRHIVDIARALGIATHDHIIVGKDGHASLKSMKLI